MLLPLNVEFSLCLFQSFRTQRLPSAESGSGMWWSPLATCGCLRSNITWAELKLHCLEFVLCLPRVRGVWFRLWGFFNQWIPMTVNFASCSQLCWVWSDFGVSGISVPSSGASPFSPRGRVNHTLRCWGFFFNTNQGKITADTEIYWPVSALSTFPGASPDLPDFCPFAAVEKLSQRAAAGIFHPTHPYSGFSGWSYWNTSGPSVTELCLVPAVFKVMQSLYFSLLIIQHKLLLVMPQPLKKDLVKWHLLLKAQNIT